MKFTKLIQEVRQLQQKTDGIYVYGAGFYGKDICRILRDNGIEIDGFLVTSKSENPKAVLGLPVYESVGFLKKDIGIVLGLSATYMEQVRHELEKYGFPMERIINGSQYIIDAGERNILRDCKALDISTVMGCPIHCHYCPQDVLTKKYYQTDRHRQSTMTLTDFKTLLEHTPEDCVMLFSGMAEPFLNPDCLEMIRMACDSGRRVYLYTTLHEVPEKTVKELVKLPVYNVTLHVADAKGYAHISTTDCYYRNIEFVTRAKKPDGRPFVDFINAQSTPDVHIAEILAGRYEVMISVQDRAGNVEDTTAEHRKTPIGLGSKMICNSCGDDLSLNLVLPDGTLILCSMDFGMQHVLGNLYEEDYDTIRSKGELQRILREFDGGMDENLLCRKCLMARIKR